jgi:RNA polymerase sigma-70 factor (ECF subfamily)
MDQDETTSYFLQIYDTYADAIFRFVLMKVSTREVAEDIVQDTFMRFWQALREGTVLRSDRALLYTIARNLVIDWYRKKKDASLDKLLEEGIEFAGNDTHRILEQAEVKEALRAINTLDEPSREALTLRFVDGLSPSDIAELTGDTANAVSVRLNRAVKKLQTVLHTDTL